MVVGLQYVAAGLRDFRKSQSSVQESLHRHFVGGIQHRTACPPGSRDFIPQLQGREAVQIGRLEFQ